MSTVINGSSPSITFSDGTTQTTAANITAPYTSNGVVYASSTTALATGSALTFDGTNLSVANGYLYAKQTSTSNSNQQLDLRNSANTTLQGYVFGPSSGGYGASTAGEAMLYSNSTGLTLMSDNGSGIIKFATGGSSEKMRLDSSGNLGLGVTPSSASLPTIQSAFGLLTGNNESTIANNAIYNSGFKYVNTGAATKYYQTGGQHSWHYASSGSAGGAVSFTQAMTLDNSGNLGLGTSSPSTPLEIYRDTASTGAGFYPNIRLNNNNASGYSGFYFNQGATLKAFFELKNDVGALTIGTSSEAMRIDSSNNLLVGTTSGSSNTIQNPTQTQANINLLITNCSKFYVSGGAFGNAAATSINVNSNTATGRSINANGTINAAGLDYAEYMTKSGDFTIAKGDICGIDVNGKLTNVFSNAISFVVKSTNPSYVGGDTWGNNIEGEELENARQLVDRIAFSGQVPVNVTGATVGQYIIPINDNGSIKGEAISNPTFEQYMSAVGKVIAIEQDGRAKIIVKVS